MHGPEDTFLAVPSQFFLLLKFFFNFLIQKNSRSLWWSPKRKSRSVPEFGPISPGVLVIPGKRPNLGRNGMLPSWTSGRKSKRAGPKGANWAKKGPFGATSALPQWL